MVNNFVNRTNILIIFLNHVLNNYVNNFFIKKDQIKIFCHRQLIAEIISKDFKNDFQFPEQNYMSYVDNINYIV